MMMMMMMMMMHGLANVKSYHAVNPLKPELNPICYLMALLGAHHFLHVSRIRVKLLTLRRLMSCMLSNALRFGPDTRIAYPNA